MQKTPQRKLRRNRGKQKIRVNVVCGSQQPRGTRKCCSCTQKLKVLFPDSGAEYLDRRPFSREIHDRDLIQRFAVRRRVWRFEYTFASHFPSTTTIFLATTLDTMAEAPLSTAGGFEILVENLTYHHAPGAPPSLSDVNIHLPKGSRALLVGANGGKS